MSDSIEFRESWENVKWLDLSFLDQPLGGKKVTPMTSQDHFAYYPGTGQTLTLENALLVALIMKLSKTKEGLQILERITIKYLDSCARVVASVEDACHSNWLTALNNQHIALGICHKLGLVGDHSYINTMEHYRAVFDKMLTQKYIVEGLSTLQHVVVGSQSSGLGPGYAGGKGLGALADAIGVLKG